MSTIFYTIQTDHQISLGTVKPTLIDCPACGIDRGLCLSTSGDWQPVTGSCPAGHVWDETRVTGAMVKQKALDLSEEGR